MNQKISYRDALIKNPEKSFDVSKKIIISQYARKDIRKLCTSGDLEELKRIPLKVFTEETKDYLLKNMKDKIVEIEMWKSEDHNQLNGKLEEFDLRIKYIETCFKYIELLS